jgi:hypothetical protein
VHPATAMDYPPPQRRSVSATREAGGRPALPVPARRGHPGRRHLARGRRRRAAVPCHRLRPEPRACQPLPRRATGIAPGRRPVPGPARGSDRVAAESGHLSRPRLLAGAAAPQRPAGRPRREPGQLPPGTARPVPAAPAPAITGDRHGKHRQELTPARPGTEYPDLHATATPSADPRSRAERRISRDSRDQR